MREFQWKRAGLTTLIPPAAARRTGLEFAGNLGGELRMK
jgi:hypothetical protein